MNTVKEKGMSQKRGNGLIILLSIISAFFAQNTCSVADEKRKDSGQGFIASYLGGSAEEECWAVALDEEENVYVAGYTYSSDFPVVPGSYRSVSGGKADVFVIKFDKDLTKILASTVLGGEDDDLAYSLLYDKKGSLYVAGKTKSQDFPITSSAYSQKHNGGSGDAFVFKMDKNLRRLEASTYLGGNVNENTWICGTIAMDTKGNIIIAGNTSSKNFPTTRGAFREKYNGGSLDGFVSILDNGLSHLLYSTYIGGNGNENIMRGLYVDDQSGEIYVAGITDSLDFPIFPKSDSRNECDDGFIARFSPDLSMMNASTRLNGAVIMCLLLHENGDVYVGGHARKDLPTTSRAYYRTFDQHPDQGFISRYSHDLSLLKSSTVLPGSFPVGGGAIACLSLTQNSEGDIISSGWARPMSFPATAGAFDETPNGGVDTYILVMDRELSNIKTSTFIGGSKDERWNRHVMDRNGGIYLSGFTNSADFPVTVNSAFGRYHGGEFDGFVVRINGNLSAVTASEFHDAAKRNELGVIKQLLAGNRELLEKTDSYKRTALHAAARYGGNEVCRFLIEQGANLDVKDESGNTPLHLASLHRHDEIVDLLIRAKADLNALNQEAASPLSLAVIYGTPQSVRRLLSQNADRDFKDRDGNTLLHLASYYGYPEKVMELLKYQPDVNAKNNEGSTPLQLCCLWTDSPETIKKLLRSGADPAAADGNGKNSLHLAFSAFFSSPEKLNAILDMISEVNVQDRDGNTPLHHTMLRILRTGSWPALRNRIEILLKKSADPDIKNKEGKSVMDLAIESGLGEIVDLMKKGK